MTFKNISVLIPLLILSALFVALDILMNRYSAPLILTDYPSYKSNQIIEENKMIIKNLWSKLEAVEGEERKDLLATIYNQTINPSQLEIALMDHNNQILLQFGYGPFENKIKLSGTPFQNLGYKITVPSHDLTPPKEIAAVSKLFTQIQSRNIIILILFALISYLLISRSLKENLRISHKIYKGDYNKRFVTNGFKEFSGPFLRMNKVLNTLKKREEGLVVSSTNKLDLLQELAHDLRTPISGLKGLLETLHDRYEDLPKEKVKDLLAVSLNETDYFNILVQDLLFLARISEGKDLQDIEDVNLKSIIEDEIYQIADKYAGVKYQTDIPIHISPKANAKLMRRLIRNALENASSYAQNILSIDLKQDEKYIFITIKDDGPGIDEMAIQNFGKKKFSRSIPQKKDGRISIGLGSVIMRTIAEKYNGDLVIKNRDDRRGTELIIKLAR